MKIKLILLFFLVFATKTLAECKMKMTAPRFKYEHIDLRGYLHLSTDLFEDADFGGYIEFPTSPYALTSHGTFGPGWLCPILDAKAIKVSEIEYLIARPDGVYQTYKATNTAKDEQKISCGEKWKGKVKGKTISIASECGIYIEYKNARIAKLIIKDKTYEWERKPDLIIIKLNGKTIVSTETNKNGWTIRHSNESIKIEKKEHGFEIQTKDAKLTVDDIQEKGTGKCNFRGVESTYTYDPKTGLITQFDEWAYTIEPNGNYATVTRRRPDGFTQKWAHSDIEGYDRDDSGPYKTYKEWHTAGPLQGKTKYELIQDNAGKNEYKYFYDENGNLLFKQDIFGIRYWSGFKKGIFCIDATADQDAFARLNEYCAKHKANLTKHLADNQPEAYYKTYLEYMQFLESKVMWLEEASKTNQAAISAFKSMKITNPDEIKTINSITQYHQNKINSDRKRISFTIITHNAADSQQEATPKTPQ